MDISQMVFHPPTYKPSEAASQLLANESIERTSCYDSSPQLDTVLPRYTLIPTNAVRSSPQTSKSDHRGEVNCVMSVSSHPSPFTKYCFAKTEVGGNVQAKQLEVPFLVIRPPKSRKVVDQQADIVFVLFHSNAEDIFKSASLGRKMAEAFEVSHAHQCTVVIPEYRGYSLLAAEKVDPEATREDMLSVVHYLNHAMGVDFSDMVLVVGLLHPGQKRRLLLFYLHR